MPAHNVAQNIDFATDNRAPTVRERERWSECARVESWVNLCFICAHLWLKILGHRCSLMHITHGESHSSPKIAQPLMAGSNRPSRTSPARDDRKRINQNAVTTHENPGNGLPIRAAGRKSRKPKIAHHNMNKSKEKSPAKNLLDAVTAGDITRVQELIKSGADLSEWDEESPLSQAAEMGRADIVDVLLKAGADVNYGGIWVPLCGAARSRNAATVKRLLEAKPKVDLQEEEGDTALMYAAGLGDLEIIKMLVAAGASPKKKDNDGRTAILHGKDFPQVVEFLKPLSTKADVKYLEKELSEPDETTETFLAAVEAGDIPRVKAMLGKGVKLGALGKSGESALHQAVDEENMEIVELLLKSGASPNVRNQNGSTPLFVAVNNHNSELVERLLRAGADINAKQKSHGQTPFLSSVGKTKRDQDMMRLLARYGADVHAVDAYGRSALNAVTLYLGKKQYSSEEDRQLTDGLRKTLVDVGILYPDSNRYTEAAAAGDVDAVRRFFESGLPVDAVDDEERTGLYMAISRRHPELVAYLLKAGADVHRPTGRDSDEDGRLGGHDRPCPKCGHVFTALTRIWRCTKCAHEFKAQEVFDRYSGDELFMLWSNGHLPLVTAARLGDLQIITLLLDAGADVDRGKGKITPLMYACYFGHLEAARILIGRGANPKAEAKEPDLVAKKVTPIVYAAKHGHIEIVKLLWDSGVPAKEKNSTLFIDAARRNDVPAIQRLLAEGLDVNQPDPLTGERALNMAAQDGNAEAAAVLVAAGALVDPSARELPALWFAVNGFGVLRSDKQRTPDVVERYVGTAKVLLAAGARSNTFIESEAKRMKCTPILELFKPAAKK